MVATSQVFDECCRLVHAAQSSDNCLLVLSFPEWRRDSIIGHLTAAYEHSLKIPKAADLLANPQSGLQRRFLNCGISAATS